MTDELTALADELFSALDDEEQQRRTEQIKRIVEDNIEVWRELAKYD